MRKIAIVGAGDAGLHLALGLLRHKYEVTLVSRRTPQQILQSRIGSSAFLFHQALQIEHDLDLDFWPQAPRGEAIHVDFCIEPGERALSIDGRFQSPGQAVDSRLKHSSWLTAVERRGGRLVFKSAGRGDLEDLADDHDLVVIATGKSGLRELFPVDREKTVFDQPRRKLTLLLVQNLGPDLASTPHLIKLAVVAGVGEVFWVPFYARPGDPCFSLLFEAEPAGRMDRFDRATSGREALRLARRCIEELTSWESSAAAEMRLVDDLSWLKGSITPTVRKPVGSLPSGKVVMALGDAAIVNDPIAGQGANNAIKHAKFLTDRIVARGSRPFDVEWMEHAFHEYWEQQAKQVTSLCNALLQPLPATAEKTLIYALKVSVLTRMIALGCGSSYSMSPVESL